MVDEKIRIFALGDTALTVEFCNVISAPINNKAIALANHIENERFPGFVESVPAYASTTIFYHPFTVKRNFPEFTSAFDAVKTLAEHTLKTLPDSSNTTPRLVEIPVHFDAESSLDLNFVAEHAGIAAAEVIEIFTRKTYRVFMLGFLPGFTYMGEVDERIATPRKETPRTLLPKGSVGIAGRQTGIYSLASPGGWQIVGRTDLEIFTPYAETPSFLQPGDEVKFIPVK